MNDKAILLAQAKRALQQAQNLIAQALGDTDTRWDTEFAIDEVIADLNADLGILESKEHPGMNIAIKCSCGATCQDQIDECAYVNCASRQPFTRSCVACEDHPAPGNSPCAVCGKT